MKVIKLSLVIMATALLTIGLGGMAYAFHNGGVANCESCHTMHNSSGDAAILAKDGASQFKGVAYLLRGGDQSSTCLNCHAASDGVGHGYVVMTYSAPAAGNPPLGYSPGGDFAWLAKTYSSSDANGSRHGHNIIAMDFSLGVDQTLIEGPGGKYQASDLSCISCHDPHPKARIDSNYKIVYPKIGTAVPPIYQYGSYGDAPTATEAVGVYRLLGGNGYKPMSVTSPAFINDPPVAVAPKTYNRKETATNTRVAYGSGMSEWCANCHKSIHADDLSNFIHPASSAAGARLGSTIAANYNAYVKSGDLTGDGSTSYTSLVPFEEGLGLNATNINALKTDAAGATTGPSGTANVMCLTCHRAHASGFNNMTRWNNAEFITSAGAYVPPSGMSTTEYQAAMYDRPASNYATYQRSLCNKCHVKD